MNPRRTSARVGIRAGLARSDWVLRGEDRAFPHVGWGRLGVGRACATSFFREGCLSAGRRWVSWLGSRRWAGDPYSCGTAPDFRMCGHRLPLGGSRIRAKSRLGPSLDCEGSIAPAEWRVKLPRLPAGRRSPFPERPNPTNLSGRPRLPVMRDDLSAPSREYLSRIRRLRPIPGAPRSSPPPGVLLHRTRASEG
jgi:hypothetical protein